MARGLGKIKSWLYLIGIGSIALLLKFLYDWCSDNKGWAALIGGGLIAFWIYRKTKYQKFEKKKEIVNRSRHITENVRRAVWRRDEGRCVQCASQEKLEFDHIIPFSKGGSNTERNIQLLCEKCNREKSNKI